MTRNLTLNQTNKLFEMYAANMYDSFRDSVIQLYLELFPGKDEMNYDLAEKIADRLLIEFSLFYSERKMTGRKNGKKKARKNAKATC